MFQQEFALNAAKILAINDDVTGLAAGGSYISGQIDQFSDLDLVLVTKHKITQSIEEMIKFAQELGDFISGFRGDHVGEPRLLICLYGSPLLHVDIKFVTLEEFKERVENPVILLDKQGLLQRVMDETEAHFPQPDFQWIEDRFWTWIHYALVKIARGEYTEAIDFLSFLRMAVLGPLLHVKNGNLPRGVRKVEMELKEADLEALKSTISGYSKPQILKSLKKSVELYRSLRMVLFPSTVKFQERAENTVLIYWDSLPV